MNRFVKIIDGKKTIWCAVEEGRCYEITNSIYDDAIRFVDNPAGPVEGARLLAPCDAQKVIALAYNYKGLVKKKGRGFDEPLVFFKSPTGLIAHGDTVLYPSFAKKVWQEVELAIVVKARCKNISAKEAPDYILGYTCGNDITCENILNRDWHLARSKGLDTFCPLGPFLVKGADTADLRLTSSINGRVTQDSRTSDRILNDYEALALVSRYVTLMPGDVILTGTPSGATDAVIHPGDTIKAEIEKIGILENHVREEKTR